MRGGGWGYFDVSYVLSAWTVVHCGGVFSYFLEVHSFGVFPVIGVEYDF